MNNPFLVCSDCELRALPARWLHAERWDKAGRLLYDLEFMEATVRRLGIDALLQDYATALHLLSEKEDWRSELATTNRALDRQAHNLRGWDAEAQPAFFLQQLRNEALELGIDEIQVRAEAELARLGRPYVRERSKTSHDSPELVRTLAGHTNCITGVAITPDGHLAISASEDGTLKVWELENGKCLRTLEGHTGGVESVAITPDGHRAVSPSSDRTLKIWDLDSGQCRRTLEGHMDHVQDVVVTPDGRRAVSASGDETLKLWDSRKRAMFAHVGRPYDDCQLRSSRRRGWSPSYLWIKGWHAQNLGYGDWAMLTYTGRT